MRKRNSILKFNRPARGNRSFIGLWWSRIIVPLVILGTVLYYTVPQLIPKPEKREYVTSFPIVTVIDGDTYRSKGKKLRLLGIDTPEPSTYGNAECPEEAELGDKATAFAKTLVTGKYIEIHRSGRKDKYGRDLVDLYDFEGNSIADVLIQEGLAEPWRGRQADWCAILGVKD